MDKDLESLKNLSRWLDSKFEGPLGFRFGWDALLGLVPVLGDIVTTVFSAFIIIRAAEKGCSPLTLFRMVFNVLIENILDLIPIAGNLFDFYWKSNAKNIKLLEAHLLDSKRLERQSWVLVSCVLGVFFAMAAGVVYLSFKLYGLILVALKS